MPCKLVKKNRQANDKIIIGIVGMLLQGNPYKTLLENIKNNDLFEVHIYGRGDFQNMIEKYAKSFDNIKYFGDYNFFKDSAKIYSMIDLLYMPYDTTNGSLNNLVALPNKLYEAMYFQVPIITSEGTYVGEIVKKYGIGFLISCCNDSSLNNLLNNIIDELPDIISNFDNLDEKLYIADNDYINFEKYISN